MHDMIKRFYGQGGPQKFKPFNGIHSYQNPESITARIVGKLPTENGRPAVSHKKG